MTIKTVKSLNYSSKKVKFTIIQKKNFNGKQNLELSNINCHYKVYFDKSVNYNGKKFYSIVPDFFGNTLESSL